LGPSAAFSKKARVILFAASAFGGIKSAAEMNSLLSRDDRRLTLTAFEAIRRTLNRHAGLWFSLDMRTTVERRLRERLTFLGLESFDDYASRLEQDQGELEEATELCTVNETYAFRGMRQLVAFREGIIPRFGPKDRITVWSEE